MKKFKTTAAIAATAMMLSICMCGCVIDNEDQSGKPIAYEVTEDNIIKKVTEKPKSYPNAIRGIGECIFKKECLDYLSELKPNNKAGALQKLITSKKIFNSNKNEIDVILDILGICGVLENKEHYCYSEGFMDCTDRNPPENTNDYAYPVNWWRAQDGINTNRIKVVFPMMS